MTHYNNSKTHHRRPNNPSKMDNLFSTLSHILVRRPNTSTTATSANPHNTLVTPRNTPTKPANPSTPPPTISPPANPPIPAHVPPDREHAPPSLSVDTAFVDHPPQLTLTFESPHSPSLLCSSIPHFDSLTSELTRDELSNNTPTRESIHTPTAEYLDHPPVSAISSSLVSFLDQNPVVVLPPPQQPSPSPKTPDQPTAFSCPCCRTDIQFSTPISTYQCSVCDYIADLVASPDPTSNPEIKPLTLDGLQQLLSLPPSAPVVRFPAPQDDVTYTSLTLDSSVDSVYTAPISMQPYVPPWSEPSSKIVGSSPPDPDSYTAQVQSLAYTPESARALDLCRYLRQVFSSWSLLNSSLLVHPTTATAKPQINVNLSATREAWSLIVAQPRSVHIAVLTAAYSLLTRIRHKLAHPSDLNFLVILLESPLLHRETWSPPSANSTLDENLRLSVLSRVLGHLSALPNYLHHFFVEWSTQWNAYELTNMVELMNQFLTHRLQSCPPARSKDPNEDGRLIASQYTKDWQIIATCRCMALLFSVNNKIRKIELSVFYNTMVDLKVHLLRDFDSWERRQLPFTFCQYPFTLSLAAKLTLLDFEAKRAMFHKFREAVAAQGIAEIANAVQHRHMNGFMSRSGTTRRFFTIGQSSSADQQQQPETSPRDDIPSREQQMPFIPLLIRRSHLVEDSLTQLSDPKLDLKKRIRVQFDGEEGIDAGGLTKEWLLLLVRDLFDPSYGMWVELNPGSGIMWFNPACSDLQEYYLVGVVVGLALYHSTILAIPLASPCFRKLLKHPVGINDLAVLDPDLAHGLVQLLEYSGDDVEDVFCRDFVGEFEAYGQVHRRPLVENGENIPVTNENRVDFVKRLVEFKLTISVMPQFNCFYQGFLRVLQGNALSLFRPEEIELLVRGTTEIDIAQLEITAEYDGFSESHPTIRMLWDVLEEFDSRMRANFIRFLTGTDRVPATGVTVKIVCIEPHDSDRLPLAHTCFNQLGLYVYRTREKLKQKLVMAVLESEGFGIK